MSIRSWVIALGAAAIVIVAVLVVLRFSRPPGDASKQKLTVYTTQREKTNPKLAEWGKLNFDSVQTRAQVDSAVDKLKLNLQTFVDASQEKALRKTISEFLYVNAKWDLNGYVQFCQERDMIVLPTTFEAYHGFYSGDKYRKMGGTRTDWPNDPIEFFKAQPRIEAPIIAIATQNSFITIGNTREELQGVEASDRLFDYKGSGSHLPYFVSRFSPEELTRSGNKVIWAKLSIILRHQQGRAIPHHVVFFWNPQIHNWVPNDFKYQFTDNETELLY